MRRGAAEALGRPARPRTWYAARGMHRGRRGAEAPPAPTGSFGPGTTRRRPGVCGVSVCVGGCVWGPRLPLYRPSCRSAVPGLPRFSARTLRDGCACAHGELVLRAVFAAGFLRRRRCQRCRCVPAPRAAWSGGPTVHTDRQSLRPEPWPRPSPRRPADSVQIMQIAPICGLRIADRRRSSPRRSLESRVPARCGEHFLTSAACSGARIGHPELRVAGPPRRRPRRRSKPSGTLVPCAQQEAPGTAGQLRRLRASRSAVCAVRKGGTSAPRRRPWLRNGPTPHPRMRTLLPPSTPLARFQNAPRPGQPPLARGQPCYCCDVGMRRRAHLAPRSCLPSPLPDSRAPEPCPRLRSLSLLACGQNRNTPALPGPPCAPQGRLSQGLGRRPK